MKGIPFASKKLALETAFDLQSPCCDFSKRSAWEVLHGLEDLKIKCVVNVSVDRLLALPFLGSDAATSFHRL
ncbi:MAG: hypothetical protein WB581_04590 [Halobacteriota archaeon]